MITGLIFKIEMADIASKILVFGGSVNHRTPVRLSSTRGIKHWGLSVYASILPRIKFGVTGQDCRPQFPTYSKEKPNYFAIIQQFF